MELARNDGTMKHARRQENLYQLTGSQESLQLTRASGIEEKAQVASEKHPFFARDIQ